VMSASPQRPSLKTIRLDRDLGHQFGPTKSAADQDGQKGVVALSF
jgi:hypothetical protein